MTDWITQALGPWLGDNGVALAALGLSASTLAKHRRRTTVTHGPGVMATAGGSVQFTNVTVHNFRKPVSVLALSFEPIEPSEAGFLGTSALEPLVLSPGTALPSLGEPWPVRPRLVAEGESVTWQLVATADDDANLDDFGGTQVRVRVELMGRRALFSKPFRIQVRPPA